MSLDIVRMRKLVRQGLGGFDESDLIDEDVDEVLNLSLWDIEDKFPFELKENKYRTTLVVGQSIYDLSTMPRLDAIRSVVVFDDNDQSNKLDRTTRDWYDVHHNTSEDHYGMPVKYFREGNKLRLWPTPGSNQNDFPLHVAMRQSLRSMDETEQLTSGLPRNWDEIVVQGALWRALVFYRNDENRAREILNFQLGLIRSAVTTEAKEEEDSRLAGVQPLTEWPE